MIDNLTDGQTHNQTIEPDVLPNADQHTHTHAQRDTHKSSSIAVPCIYHNYDGEKLS